MTFAGLLIHTVDVLRPHATPDGVGGFSEWWEVLTPPLVCRIQPVSADERDRSAQWQHERSHRIFFNGSADVQPIDMLRYGTRLFKVTGTRDVDEWGRILTVSALEVESDAIANYVTTPPTTTTPAATTTPGATTTPVP